MKKIAFGLIVTMLLLACANTQSYDNKLDMWVGQSETKLMNAWGRPGIQRIISPTEKIVVYTKVQDGFVPTEYFSEIDDWSAQTVIYQPYMNEYNFTPFAQTVDNEVQEICQTSFWIKNGIITSWKWRGNNCY